MVKLGLVSRLLIVILTPKMQENLVFVFTSKNRGVMATGGILSHLYFELHQL